MNKIYTDFRTALGMGKYNEAVIAHEFQFHGLPVKQTEGKHDVDFYLPDGRSVEVKLDIRSQCTGSGAIEKASLDRLTDIYIHTFTFARVFTFAQYSALYNAGRIPDNGMGDNHHDARYVRNMGREGIPMYQFIKDLKQKAA